MAAEPPARDSSMLFLSAGSISLINFSVISIFSPFFDFFVPNSTFSVIFFSSLGNFLSFFLATLLAKSLNKIPSTKIFTVLILALIFGLFLSCIHLKSLAIMAIFAFLSGFFGSWRRSIVTAMASEISPSAVRHTNLGISIGSLSLSALISALNKILPIDGETTFDDKKTNHQLQCYSMLAFMTLIFGTFLILFQKWSKRIENLQTGVSSNSKEAASNFEKNLSLRAIFLRSMDLDLSLAIGTIVTVNSVDFCIYSIWKKYHIQGSSPVAFYMMIYSVFDTIGRMLPVKYLISSSRWVHVVILSKLLVLVYHFWLLVCQVEGIMVSEIVRILAIAYVGLTAGYILNSVICVNRNRFSHPSMHFLSAYFNIFSVQIGIFMASGFGMLLSAAE